MEQFIFITNLSFFQPSTTIPLTRGLRRPPSRVNQTAGDNGGGRDESGQRTIKLPSEDNSLDLQILLKMAEESTNSPEFSAFNVCVLCTADLKDKNAKLLPCLHTLCENCLNSLFQVQVQQKRPEDGAEKSSENKTENTSMFALLSVYFALIVQIKLVITTAFPLTCLQITCKIFLVWLIACCTCSRSLRSGATCSDRRYLVLLLTCAKLL